MIQIPRNHRKQKVIEQTCAVKGCGKVFYGIQAAKYCQHHRDPQNRDKKSAETKDVSQENLVFEHENTDVTQVLFKCALEGCGQEYEVKIYPRQYVYPKYCPEHRNEHKRKQHILNMENRTGE